MNSTISLPEPKPPPIQIDWSIIAVIAAYQTLLHRETSADPVLSPLQLCIQALKA
jgi:hypothetical protein